MTPVSRRPRRRHHPRALDQPLPLMASRTLVMTTQRRATPLDLAWRKTCRDARSSVSQAFRVLAPTLANARSYADSIPWRIDAENPAKRGSTWAALPASRRWASLSSLPGGVDDDDLRADGARSARQAGGRALAPAVPTTSMTSQRLAACGLAQRVLGQHLAEPDHGRAHRVPTLRQRGGFTRFAARRRARPAGAARRGRASGLRPGCRAAPARPWLPARAGAGRRRSA